MHHNWFDLGFLERRLIGSGAARLPLLKGEMNSPATDDSGDTDELVNGEVE